MRVTINILSLLGCVSLFINCSSAIKPNKESPINIIYILADDLGYGDLGFLGQQTIATPNLDRMSNEGMVFTRHYTGSAVCAPSRACLLTGKHTGNSSVVSNGRQLIKDEEVTVAEALKQAGYVTGAIGKWGVGHPPPVNDPQRNGFDYFYGYINMWHAHNFFPEFLYRNGQKVYLNNKQEDFNLNNDGGEKEGRGVAEEKNTYAHDLFDREALQFIEKNKDTTFFLYLAYNVPHANNEAGRLVGDGMEVKDYGEFADKNWPNPEKGFAKMIRNLDNSAGTILSKLRELNIDKNTLVIFTSDNGPHQEGNHEMEFFNSNGELRGMKRDLYEGGVRTPFIAWWPGTIEPGSSSDHLSAFWDFLPTACDVAGVQIPKDIDGISFLPSLLGIDKKQQKHDYLYWYFPEQGGKQSVIIGNYKAVRFNVLDNPSPIELYDLENDKSESKNLALEHSKMINEIEDIFAKYENYEF